MVMLLHCGTHESGTYSHKLHHCFNISQILQEYIRHTRVIHTYGTVPEPVCPGLYHQSHGRMFSLLVNNPGSLADFCTAACYSQ